MVFSGNALARIIGMSRSRLSDSDCFDNSATVEYRHHEIHDRQVGRGFFEASERVLSVEGGHDVEASIAEDEFKDLEHPEFIVDDQNSFASRARLFALLHPLQLISYFS